jgi:hypothetical protein
VPSRLLVVKNGSKILCMTAGAMPAPVSATLDDDPRALALITVERPQGEPSTISIA